MFARVIENMLMMSWQHRKVMLNFFSHIFVVKC